MACCGACKIIGTSCVDSVRTYFTVQPLKCLLEEAVSKFADHLYDSLCRDNRDDKDVESQRDWVSVALLEQL